MHANYQFAIIHVHALLCCLKLLCSILYKFPVTLDEHDVFTLVYLIIYSLHQTAS